MRVRLIAIAIATLIGLASPTATLGLDDRVFDAATPQEGATAERFVVVLRDGADVPKILERLEKKLAFKADHAYRHALRGFSARLSPGQERQLRRDPDVAAIVPDETFTLAAQIVPTGVARVGGQSSDVAAIDGVDARIDADVAIVDTGITPHPDLDVVGGYNCTTADRTAWRDQNSHGTHVAGTVGALDNDIGVVGVAPGARLWAVKILGADGNGYLSWYVCGIDWILAQRDPLDASRPLFEVANMSLGKPGSDDRACGTKNGDVVHQAICRLVGGGVPVVVAAMNYRANAANYIPASYDEVITVSALADTDGRPGGLGGHRCYSWGGWDVDDTFADFSDYGADVDIIAPGKCIWSTIPGGYKYLSGTSMATPAVAGAVALYKANHPNATPAQVRTILRSLGNQGWRTSTDPDGTHEPLLDVSRIGGIGDFAIDLPAGPLMLGESGGPIAITIERTSDCFEPLVWTVEGLPPGASATVVPAVPGGFDATSATLSIKLTGPAPEGTYRVTVSGAIDGRGRSDSVDVSFVDLPPVAYAPVATLARLPTPTLDSVSLHVAWPAATDGSGIIGGYTLDSRVDGGAWAKLADLPGTVTAKDALFPLGHRHGFRLTAWDAGGLASSPVAGADVRLRSFQETTAAVAYSGSWTRTPYAGAMGGGTKWTTQAGASLTFTFTGRQVGLIAPRGPTRGDAKVYLDGILQGTVRTWAPAGVSHQVIIIRFLADPGPHVLRVVALGTVGHPRIDLDAFVVVP